MEIVTFLLCILVLTSNVYTNPIDSTDETFELRLKEVHDAEEFLKSIPSKLDHFDIDENTQVAVKGFFTLILELIQLGPVNAFEIVDKLAEIEKLMHQASKIQSGGKDLKEVLTKLENVKEVIVELKDHHKVDALESVSSKVRSSLDVVATIRELIESNPENLLEHIFQSENDLEILTKSPKYLKYLIQYSYPVIIENLWAVELAVESIKSAYPSEIEVLKKIIREAEAKIFSLKRETKRVIMQIEMNKNLITHPENSESLIRAREDLLENNAVDVVYKRNQILDEDEQDELTDKILLSVSILDRVDDQFIEDTENAVELFKSKFPENANNVDNYLGMLIRSFDDFINSVRTITEKIKIDTAEGARTNPLYIEMFTRIIKEKISHVHRYQFEIFKMIEAAISVDDITSEDEEITDEVLKTLVDVVIEHRSQPAPLHEYMEKCAGVFSEFSPGLFQWGAPNDNIALYTNYIRS